ncbi:ferritin-like isoform X1 [Homarus americanus]|uniref:Ferritin n=1 Tax=Homarus americanus TaxID=6706 RepID=A0A8J5TTW1_HOMAM|nr:ferritin-like isoform X1 [Homarus americanus]KAG7177002.1 Ferritin-like 1 [Homarus americanus]
MASAIRQNYHEESEAAINKHINLELHASYTFLSMGYHFERDDVALPGLSKFFKDHSDFELDNAQTLMKYQNQRGGRVVLQAIPAPCQQEWGQGMEALQVALDLKKQINKSLLDVREVASKKDDAHAAHYLDDTFLDEQIKTIKKLGDMLKQLQRAGEKDLGLHIFDRDL